LKIDFFAIEIIRGKVYDSQVKMRNVQFEESGSENGIKFGIQSIETVKLQFCIKK